MSIPEWADTQLSRDLASLIERGEGQNLEFKSKFPNNGSELAREIAAFATSGAGTLLVGVSNDGELLGIQGAAEFTERDRLTNRLAGLCKHNVQPAITPEAKFAVRDDKIVLAVFTPKGSDPVYYSQNKPYLRHLTEARPAQPHEVIELIRSWLPTSGLDERDENDFERGNFYGEVAKLLIEILIIGDELEERICNPWLEELMDQFASTAAALRDVATQSLALAEKVDGDLETLANLADKAAHVPLYSGYHQELAEYAGAASEMAQNLKARWIDSQPLSEDSQGDLRQLLFSSNRRLRSIALRASEMLESGRTEELQDDVSEIGYEVLQASYFELSFLDVAKRESLREIGRRLHLVETIGLRIEGGRSSQSVQSEISACRNRLDEIVSQLQ